MKPWEEYQNQQSVETTENAPWLEYQQAPAQPKVPSQPRSFIEAALDRPTNPLYYAKKGIDAVRGIYSGTEDVGTGIYQAAADSGVKFEGAKKVLSMIRPDLRNEIQSMTSEDISQVLADKFKQKNIAAQDESLPYKAARAVTQVAPLAPIAIGSGVPGLVASGTIGGLVSGALSPQEQAGLENRATEALKGGATGGVVGGGLGLASKAAPYIPTLIKTGMQKLTGVKPELAKAFQDAGVTPRLADISTSKPTKAFQNLLEVFPGSASTIQKATQNQIDDITKQLARVTKSGGGTIQEAGKQIQEGAKSFKGFIEKRVSGLYDDLDQFIPNKQVESFPTNNLKNLTQDAQIQDIAAVGTGDTAKILARYSQIVDETGNISYPRLKIFRSTVGKKLESASLGGDERTGIKKIYGALSEDMKAAVVANGGEKGLQAFNKANSAFARSQDFLEKNINPLIEDKVPEKVYQMAMAGIKQGGSNIKPIMKALNPRQQEFVRGTVIKNMGLQNAGLQDETGAVFSPNKFLTEWNKLDNEMNREAVQNLFTKPQVEAVRKLNAAISNIKETSKIAQKSNNLPYMNWLGLGGAIIASPATIVQGAGAVTGARISAELMTNPKFVNWLAQAPKVSAKDIPNHLRMLSIMASRDPDIQEDVLDYLDSITSVGDAQASDLRGKSVEEIQADLDAQYSQSPYLKPRGMSTGEISAQLKNRYK